MKEVIGIQVGRCGNKIGTKFWDVISEEHGIGPDGTYSGSSGLQLERIGVYFKETKENKYFPRSVVVDLDPDSLNTVLQSTHRSLFRSENFVFGRGSASNCWAKGFYDGGRRYIDRVLEVLRKEAEICDGLQGIDLNHSLGGGTGSGFGALMIAKISEQYPKRFISTFSTFPSVKVLGIVTEPYNVALSLKQLTENVDITYCIDNEALYDIALRLGNGRLNYDDLNHLASMVMSGITSFLRFSGKMDSDLGKLISSMISFPKLHFLVSSFVSLDARNIALSRAEVNELFKQLFHPGNIIATCDTGHGHCLGASAMFRGQVSMDEIESLISSFRNTLSPELLPDNIKLDTCEIPARGTTISGTLVANTTAIREVFARIEGQFETMFRRRAFFHWYTREGMEETEFMEAGDYIRGLISEYIDCEDLLNVGNPYEMIDD
ncbi:unnamed protein product [Cercopithifilaria johnstoni]|uniref:Tubulin beta chain n=1 Tax=Cercopithifilaria johnstoni TaxID=2874296 RepID=A0A8J2MAZ8_9BILA|nr:unnamed protein product [Cercopithifilaria johnstoni]